MIHGVLLALFLLLFFLLFSFSFFLFLLLVISQQIVVRSVNEVVCDCIVGGSIKRGNNKTGTEKLQQETLLLKVGNPSSRYIFQENAESLKSFLTKKRLTKIRNSTHEV